MKHLMNEKYIPNQENVEKMSPKMFLRKYGILENGIHCVDCNFSNTQEKN